MDLRLYKKLLTISHYLNRGSQIISTQVYALLVQTYVTETIRGNKPETTKALVGEAKYLAYENVPSVMKRKILSNADQCGIKKMKWNFEYEKVRPTMIDDYNKYMEDVDKSGKMLYVYLEELITLKHWRSVVIQHI